MFVSTYESGNLSGGNVFNKSIPNGKIAIAQLFNFTCNYWIITAVILWKNLNRSLTTYSKITDKIQNGDEKFPWK